MAQSAVPPVAATPGLTHSADRRELTSTVIAVAAGGGLALLGGARSWSTVTVLRAAPLGPVSANVSGRTLQPAVTGLAVVALAGVLALLATRGVVRQLVGAILVLTGVGTTWRAALGLSQISRAHGRQLVGSSRTGATLGNVQAVHVTMHPIWAFVAVLGGVFVVLGGVATTARGGRWRAMSSRYESPVGSAVREQSAAGAPGGADTGVDDQGAEVARARADLALWLQLDRGEDPTDLDVDPPATATRSHPPAPGP